jgi:Uma2 family endonuclease
MATKDRVNIEDLYNIADDGKAEIVNGELVLMTPTGGKPGRAGGIIYASLLDYERRTKSGYAFPDNVGFVVDLPHRSSFSPDAAFYKGEVGMAFLKGAPVFAVEVRSENEYGEKAEEQIAKKRADYYAAGTLVVWDVDLLAENVVRVYRASEPGKPTLYRRGEVAEAEPAQPGWTLRVDDLFS